MKSRKTIAFVMASILLLLCAILLSFTIGARDIPVSNILALLKGQEVAPLYASIIEKRMIRTVLGMIAGCALGVSGCLMQAITRNPVADPSILGVNTGAALFVVSGIAFWGLNSANGYIFMALLGAASASLFVYGIASFTPGRGGIGNAGPVRLALSGAAVSTACSSLTSTVMLPRTNVLQEFRFWQVGSIGGASWGSIYTVLPIIAVGLIVAAILTPSLNVLALGDEIATGLGVKVTRVRGLGALAGVLLCGATTAVTGPIGFVGLVVPHLTRIFCGGDLRVQIPVSALNGAVLLILADVTGRILGRPGELEVGIVTAFVGAPVFIAVVQKARGSR